MSNVEKLLALRRQLVEERREKVTDALASSMKLASAQGISALQVAIEAIDRAIADELRLEKG
jgi:hypothetical protein